MKELLEIKGNELYLGGKPFYIASGDMHYFRFLKGGWERRLKLMKDFGLTCVQTYVPWNMHEPEKGEFHFEDNLDLAAFIRMAGDIGLKVLLRPSPYMCGEQDLGGLPYWLLKDRNIQIRCNEENYMRHVREYTERLAKEFVPLLSTKGGPIIAVAVENEYGSFGNDTSYIRAVSDMLRELGVDVPLYTANGHEMKHLKWGSVPEIWTGIDVGTVPEGAKETLKEFQGDRPLMVCEQWAGRAQQWGGVFFRQTPEGAAANYKNSLDKGFMVNFYMFSGGTNFGFSAGANYGIFRKDAPYAKNRYVPFETSYDVDAPISEEGRPTEKYYELKKVLCEKRGIPYERNEYEYISQAPEEITLTECGSFFDSVEDIAAKKIFSPQTRTFEELDQAYGFVLYETFLEYTDDQIRALSIEGLRDRATVYLGGEYLGTAYRDREYDIRFTIPKEGAKLSILVENMGRIGYGLFMTTEHKGITDCVHLDRIGPETGRKYHDFSLLMNWEIYSLPLKDISKVTYNGNVGKNKPCFYKGTFKAEAGIDTFIKAENLEKGMIWINGFNLGRYWDIGPQERLYVPGELLKEENTIEIFELYGKENKAEVKFYKEHSLDNRTDNVEVIVEEQK